MIAFDAKTFIPPHDWMTNTRVPDQTGQAGQAWLLRPTSAKACIEGWLVHRPKAHPLWSWWVASVIHLRDVPGIRSATKNYAQAQYEFQILAIHPGTTPDPDLCDAGYRFLDPPDVIEQFHGVTDEQTQFVCRESVRWIVEGQLSPDVDSRRGWSSRLQALVEKLAQARLLAN